MKYISTLLLVMSLHGLSAQHIEFPLDTNTVTIDGLLQHSEWGNAASVMINVNTADNVRVMFKHDNTAMYFAFSGKLESANALFPEVLADPSNAGGSSWVSGQWWFHVSATDCENDGGYGIYNSCMPAQPGWEGAPNFNTGVPPTDTVEIMIPFAKLGFNPAAMDTMGISFVVTNTATIYRLYPVGADKDQPGTWTKATFSKVPAGISAGDKVPAVIVYPNPANELVYISAEKGSRVCLRSISGRILEKMEMDGHLQRLSVAQYPPGLYFVELRGADGERGIYKLRKR